MSNSEEDDYDNGQDNLEYVNELRHTLIDTMIAKHKEHLKQKNTDSSIDSYRLCSDGSIYFENTLISKSLDTTPLHLNSVIGLSDLGVGRDSNNRAYILISNDVANHIRIQMKFLIKEYYRTKAYLYRH